MVFDACSGASLRECFGGVLSWVRYSHSSCILWANFASSGLAFRGDVGDAFVSYAIKDSFLPKSLNRESTVIFAYTNIAPVFAACSASELKTNVLFVGIKVFASRLLMCVCVN